MMEHITLDRLVVLAELRADLQAVERRQAVLLQSAAAIEATLARMAPETDGSTRTDPGRATA